MNGLLETLPLILWLLRCTELFQKSNTSPIEDPVAAEISTRLSSNFGNALEKELQKKHNTQEIQTLLVDLLKGIKINYMKKIEKIGIEKLMDEAEQLHYRIEIYATVSPHSFSN